jgi:4-amino-4-deoxy-L-arabinose transferase-like glycosyltransferase
MLQEAGADVVERGSTQSGDAADHGPPQSARPSFGLILAGIALVAFVAKVAYVFYMRDQAIFVDALGYHYRAQLFADGHGIVLPAQQILGRGGNPPDAQNPPMWSLFLGVFAKLGLRSILWQQLLSCVIGTATVVMTGLAGRAAFGRRVGLIAAALVAVYPNVWVYERELVSEPLAMLGVATVILLAYRYRAAPSIWRAVALGAVVGLLALTRSEQILVMVLVAAPLVLWTPGAGWRRRITWFAVAGVACVIVVTPWTVYNLGRFERPVLLSNGAGQAMRAGNCDPTYSGEHFGSFSTIGQPGDPHGCSILTKRFAADQTVADGQLRSAALEYMSQHKTRVPVVVAARIGRTFNFFRPFQQVHIEAERRSSLWILQVAMFSYWVLLPFAVYGAVVARRRRIPIYPLVAFVAIVVISVSLTIGNVRYRAPAEIPIVLLAAVAFDQLFARWRQSRTAPAPEPAPGPTDPVGIVR